MASVYPSAPKSKSRRQKRVTIPPWMRVMIARRHDWRCHICGEPVSVDDLHIDHVIPLLLGGTNDYNNLRPAHVRCNLSKGGRPLHTEPSTTSQRWRAMGRTTAIVLASNHQAIVEATRVFPPETTDQQLIALWLHGRPETTQRAYRADVARALSSCGKPLAAMTLADLQAFAGGLAHLSPASQCRVLSSVKSILAFGHRLGLLPVNVGAALRLPKQKDTLAERILDESQVQRMLALEPDPRNAALLRLLYAGGMRVSECCGLCWRDVKARKDGCQLTLFGKGSKTRHVLVSASCWKALKALGAGQPDEPLFRSRKGGHLDPSAVWRIVRAAARRAGIQEDVSCHWLRHANASHALDRGCPIHVVQQTLGHASLSTTSKYVHARPNDSSGRYLAV